MRRAHRTWRRRRFLQGMGAGLIASSASACSTRDAFRSVATLEELREVPPGGDVVRLTQEGRAGSFRWHAGDYTAAVAKDPCEGRYVASNIRSAASGVWLREGRVLTPEMFGANAAQDDHTAVMTALFDQLDRGSIVRMDGKYRLTSGITISRKSSFSIEGAGILTMRSGTPVAHGYWILYFVECSDFRMSSVIVDANRAGRLPAEVPAHSIIFQSCTMFTCENVKSVNAVCDGFYIASATPERRETHCSNFKFIDCVADNCFRQGCSIIQAHRAVFSGGAFTNTQGTAPAAGIDLECDPGAPIGAISDISFRKVRFSGNRGFGLLVSTVSRPEEIEAIDCVFENNLGGALSWGATTGRIIRPRISGFHDGSVRGAIDVPAGDGWRGGAGTAIVGPRFSNVTTQRADKSLVYVHSEAYGPVAVTDMVADACGAIAGLNRDHSSLSGSILKASLGRVDGAISISGQGCAVVGNKIEDFYGSVILSTGNGVVIRSNQLASPRYSDDNGAIRSLGKKATIEENLVSGRGAGAGIRIGHATFSVRDNRVSGFVRPLVEETQQ